MRKLLFIPFLLVSVKGWGAIAPVGGSHYQYTTVASTTIAYSPTAGNAVVICMGRNGTITGTSATDNLSNTLSGGDALKSTGTTAGTTLFYTASSPSGVTSYTLSWTTSRTGGITIEEYSGVGSAQVLTSSMTTGSGTTEAFTTNSQVNNSWIIFCDSHATGTQTVNTGNNRQQSTVSTGRTTEADNTVATAGAVSYSATSNLTGTWGISTVELNPPSTRRRAMVVE